MTMTKVANMTSDKGTKSQISSSSGHKRDISLQSYDSLVCQIRKGSLGFDRVVAFGRDWDYSRTTVKYVNKFLRDNGFDILAGTQNIREAIERGHARLDEAVAVLYDPTMY